MDWKIEVVIVPVTDVDRAKEFYEKRAGFTVDVDSSPAEGFRIVQLTPPGSGCSVTVGDGLTTAPPGSANVQIVVDDIDTAHAELSGRGVDVSEVFHYEGADRKPGKGGTWNSFVTFSDPDGNSWTVQERPPST